jgi:endonuclease/exonuclease/phosphatase (EEP) superfamily protein YafD
MTWLIRYGFDVAFLLVAVASLMSFFGQKGWSCDLMACFRFPFLWAFGLFALGYLFRGRWQMATLCLLLAGFQFSQCVFYLPQYSLVKPVAAQTPVDLTVLQINVWKLNTKPQDVVAFITQKQPDVVAISEYTPRMHQAMGAALLAQYPYRVVRHHHEETALYSKYPLQLHRHWWTQHDHKLSEPNVESVIACRIQLKGQPVDVLMMHTLSPVDGHRYHHQQAHMAMLEDHTAEMAPTMVLLGDLNATPWSWTTRRLLRQLDLTDSEEGTMIVPTWPQWFPLLPLDHVFYRGRLRLISRQVLPAIGSDHLPVLVKFALP